MNLLTLRLATAAILLAGGPLTLFGADPLVYVGTYTRGASRGIYAYRFQGATGRLRPLGIAAEASSPSFLAAHPNGRFLYAVNEDANAVSAFEIDARTGKLTWLNTVPSGGEGPCHLALDATARWLAVANYGSGSMALIPVRPDGRLGEAATVERHPGLDRHQDAKTVGSLDSQTIQTHAWIDVATTSTESIALQACKSTETSCGAKCVNTQSDPNNCGSCGNSCGTGSCYQGSCQTSSGGTCSACQVQADSSSGMCASEYASCTGTCKSLLTCVMGCSGNTSCEQSCMTTYSSGASAFQSYFSCLCGNACSSECATQCGQ